jgi:hypothetical protein
MTLPAQHAIRGNYMHMGVARSALPRACRLLLIATAWSIPSPSTRLFLTRSLPAKSTRNNWLTRAPCPSATFCDRLSMKAACERELRSLRWVDAVDREERP